MLTFSVCPKHLRVTFIAGVSFAWLVALSAMAYVDEPVKNLATQQIGNPDSTKP